MRERDDNWRDRGLDVMMGGVLEVKKEDLLRKVSVRVSCFSCPKLFLGNLVLDFQQDASRQHVGSEGT